MANFEAINIYWNKVIKIKSNILDIKYEELVDDPGYYQKKIYDFLENHIFSFGSSLDHQLIPRT